jgi:hypothetical protein
MAYKPKRDEVSLSFHYLKREQLNEDNKLTAKPFTQKEFDTIGAELEKLTSLDLPNRKSNDIITIRVMARHLAPILKVLRPQKNLVSGLYEGAYHGHAYKNTARGEIPADSISLRPFYYLLYLSKSGKIYIVSQYLGTYGGYTALKHTIIDCIQDSKGITSNSFNCSSIQLENLQAREVEIKYSKPPKHITGKKDFGSRGALLLRKQEADDGFEELVKSAILSKARKPEHELRKAITKILRDQELMELNDDDIEGCAIIAQLDKKRRATFQLFDESSFATRFPVKVPLNTKGHPVFEPLEKEAIRILKEQVLSKKIDA